MRILVFAFLALAVSQCTENTKECDGCLSKIAYDSPFALEGVDHLNERLEAEVVAVPWEQPNFYNVKENRPVTQIILHNTVVDFTETMDIFSGKKGRRVSIHYIVDEQGLIHKALSERHIGWHAPTANELSIGVEIVAHKPGTIMPEAQEKALIELVKDIMLRHDLKIPSRVLDNSEANPNYGLVEIYSPLTTHRVVYNGTTHGAHAEARQGTLCPSYIWLKRDDFMSWRKQNFSDFKKVLSLKPLK